MSFTSYSLLAVTISDGHVAWLLYWTRMMMNGQLAMVDVLSVITVSKRYTKTYDGVG